MSDERTLDFSFESDSRGIGCFGEVARFDFEIGFELKCFPGFAIGFEFDVDCFSVLERFSNLKILAAMVGAMVRDGGAKTGDKVLVDFVHNDAHRVDLM